LYPYGGLWSRSRTTGIGSPSFAGPTPDEADLVPLLTRYYAEHIEQQQQVLSRQDRQLIARLRLAQVAGEVAARLQVGGDSFYHPDLEISGGTITVGFGVLSGSVLVTDSGSGADGSPARREQRP
jgi:hypothetical protein